MLVSLVLSILIWYFTEGFGMILTGMATDFNSGLLLVVMALACWPKTQALRASHVQMTHNLRQAATPEASQTV